MILIIKMIYTYMPRDFSIFRALSRCKTLGILFAVTRPLRLGEDVKPKPGPEFTVRKVSLGYHGGYNGGKTIIWDIFFRSL